MKSSIAILVRFVVPACLFLANVAQEASAACDQTLSVGANVAAAVANASNGSTICLNTGNYGNLSLANLGRSGFVTLQSTTGTGATLSPNVNNSKYVVFSSLTLSGGLVQGCSTHIYFVN